MTTALKNPETIAVQPRIATDYPEQWALVIDISTGLLVDADSSEYVGCMQSLQAFVTRQEVAMPHDKRAKELAATAGHIITENWLRTDPETFEDSQATASMLITLFERMPARNFISADRALAGLRAHFGLKHPPGGYDTTYSFLTRLRGTALISRMDPHGLGERLTDFQMERLISLRSEYRSNSPNPNQST